MRERRRVWERMALWEWDDKLEQRYLCVKAAGITKGSAGDAGQLEGVVQPGETVTSLERCVDSVTGKTRIRIKRGWVSLENRLGQVLLVPVDVGPSKSPLPCREFSNAWSDRLKVADEAVRRLQEAKARRESMPGSESPSTTQRRQLHQQQQRTPHPRSRLHMDGTLQSKSSAKPFSAPVEQALRRVVNELRRTKSTISSLMRVGGADSSDQDLTAGDIMNVLKRRVPGVKLHASEVGEIVAALDHDGDGHITSGEFIAAMQQVKSRLAVVDRSRPARVRGNHEGSSPVLSLSPTYKPNVIAGLEKQSRRRSPTATTTPLSRHQLGGSAPGRRRTGHCERTDSPRAKSTPSSRHEPPTGRRHMGSHETRTPGVRASTSMASRATGEVVDSPSYFGSYDGASTRTRSPRVVGPNAQELAATCITRHVRGFLVRLQVQRELAYILTWHGSTISAAPNVAVTAAPGLSERSCTARGDELRQLLSAPAAVSNSSTEPFYGLGEVSYRQTPEESTANSTLGKAEHSRIIITHGNGFSGADSDTSDSDVSVDETPVEALTRLLGVLGLRDGARDMAMTRLKEFEVTSVEQLVALPPSKAVAALGPAADILANMLS